MSCVLRISVITIWTVEPWMKTPALICLCFQALAEALKTNESVTNIGLSRNHIGAEGAKAWCVGWAPQNRWMLRHVMMSLSHTFLASSDSEKFGWFGGAGVLSFMVDRGDFFEHVDGEWKCGFLDWLPLFAKFRIREIHMLELNVFFIFAHICSQDFGDQVLMVEPTAECFCFHMFSTSFDSDKFGWFGGPLVSPLIFHRKESCQICRCCKLLLISRVSCKGSIREICRS